VTGVASAMMSAVLTMMTPPPQPQETRFDVEGRVELEAFFNPKTMY